VCVDTCFVVSTDVVLRLPRKGGFVRVEVRMGLFLDETCIDRRVSWEA